MEKERGGEEGLQNIFLEIRTKIVVLVNLVDIFYRLIIIVVGCVTLRLGGPRGLGGVAGRRITLLAEGQHTGDRLPRGR